MDLLPITVTAGDDHPVLHNAANLALNEIFQLLSGPQAPFIPESGGDWNIMTKPGRYIIGTNGQYPNNKPALGPYTCILEVFLYPGLDTVAVNGQYLIQIAIGMNGARYVRERYNGTWGAWRNGSDKEIVTQAASYTPTLLDLNRVIELNSASATVLTVPPNSGVAFPVGTVLDLARIGTGTVTITPGAGVTIPNKLEAAGTTSRTLASRYSTARLRKRATDQWILDGDIA